VWEQIDHLQTREVGEVLEHAVQRMARYLRRHGAIEAAGESDDVSAEEKLAASAVSGQAPPAGPQWLRGLAPLGPSGLAYDKPLCASLDGFTLHAATRAGALDTAGREALLRYVLRPPIGQERLEARPDGLVRIALKRAYADGTVAVDMDPLSLLCRLATSVPPPRYHTVKYAGVLAPASTWRARIAPPPAAPVEPVEAPEDAAAPKRGGAGTYRPWAELLKRTFGVDVLSCPKCKGPMKLIAMVTKPKSVARYLERHRRAHRRPRPLAQPRPALLEERRPAPQGARTRRVAPVPRREGPTLVPAGELRPRLEKRRWRALTGDPRRAFRAPRTPPA